MIELIYSVTMSLFLVIYAIYAISSVKEWQEMRKILKDMQNNQKAISNEVQGHDEQTA